MNFILNNISLILWLPLWTFFIIIFGRIFFIKIKNSIIYGLTLFSSFLGIIFCGLGLFLLPSEQIIENEFTFIQIKNFILSGGLFIDKISLIFAFSLFLISFCVQLFSITYIKKEIQIHCFFALLNLFNFIMIFLFFSPNLFQVYFLWELAGVLSYLLIGFEHRQKKKSVAAQKVFIINRFGDVLLLSGLIFCSYFMFSYSDNINFTVIPFIDINAISTLIYAYTSTPVFFIICLFFIISACIKSAQFPFFFWLQDAMEAKLPVSALLHSATIVALGIFLLVRLSAFFVLIPITLKIIAKIGLLTAVTCSLCACTKHNSKQILAYSTSAQLGLMFWVMGLLNIKICLVLFITHACIKSLLFLTLPTKDNKWNYISFLLFLISGLSLTGIILSGLCAKELAYLNCSNNIDKLLFNIIVFLTAFYTIRIIYKLFVKSTIHKIQPDIPSILSYIGLFVINIVLYLFINKLFKYSITEPFWIGLISLLCVYFLYLKNKYFKIKFLYSLCSNGFYFDKIYTKIILKQYNLLCLILNNFEKTITHNYKIILSVAISIVHFMQQIENTMNNILAILIKSILFVSKFNLILQTKNVQQYNSYAFLILVITFFYFIATHII